MTSPPQAEAKVILPCSRTRLYPSSRGCAERVVGDLDALGDYPMNAETQFVWPVLVGLSWRAVLVYLCSPSHRGDNE